MPTVVALSSHTLLSEVTHFRRFARRNVAETPVFFRHDIGIAVAVMAGMGWHRNRVAFGVLALLLLVVTGMPAGAQDMRAAPRVTLRIDPSVVASAARSVQAAPPPWGGIGVTRLPRYPFMADPRRWPRLFANTTECTLSLNPVTRRHWWQG